jgi:sulfide:quinone oxidoreductase
MDITHVEDKLAVTKQISAEDIATIASKGYAAIINNRPDGEKGDYITAAEAEALAQENGLHYLHIPVNPMQLTEEAITAFRHALENLAGPIVAHCGSGRRSSIMWALSRAGHFDADEILHRCASAGHDLSALRPRLETSG